MNGEGESRPIHSLAWPLFWTAVSLALLSGLLVISASIEDDHPAGILAPYKIYVVIALLVLLGIPIVENGSKAVLAVAQRRISPDVTGAVRIIARIAAYGIVLSVVVSALTDNEAAALTIGSFAGLVAGFASQTVMGNAVAGLFMAVTRPIKVTDTVTIGSNKGTVIDITLMHTVLDTGDSEIFIPSSTIIKSVLKRHKSND